ncbi:hypothetical protein [Streptomyces hainanensis]|uniref:Uncharacterized protein n=1 Tax=Streptomyces hainanensis TaxID=402648 RepID=A0A4R4TLQ5_9ACTN|nr:hypothetical protein [Streptomyces hainanensis]TDC77516.1 hypothetical protein E1283_07200 [Streptomyces hainanensis]
MLATIFGGRPEELRWLWEEQGAVHNVPQGPHAAARRLRHAFLGLQLAAGSSTTQDLAKAAGVPARLVARVLRGDIIPDWATTTRISEGLGEAPAALQPLWKDLEHHLVTHSLEIPEGGLAYSRFSSLLPEASQANGGREAL